MVAIAPVGPVANVDHWHAAYGFYVCDRFLDPLEDVKLDTTGLHTHGDGLIHIHPFVESVSGRNATLGKWGEVVGVEFGDQSFTLDGTTYENGFSCEGRPATVALYEWTGAGESTEPTVYTDGFAGVVLSNDGALYTIAVVPDGESAPPPETAPVLQALDPRTDSTTQPLEELIARSAP